MTACLLGGNEERQRKTRSNLGPANFGARDAALYLHSSAIFGNGEQKCLYKIWGSHGGEEFGIGRQGCRAVWTRRKIDITFSKKHSVSGLRHCDAGINVQVHSGFTTEKTNVGWNVYGLRAQMLSVKRQGRDKIFENIKEKASTQKTQTLPKTFSSPTKQKKTTEYGLWSPKIIRDWCFTDLTKFKLFVMFSMLISNHNE